YFQNAVALWPTNELATIALRDAEVLFEARRTYTVAMKRGNAALKNGKYADAKTYFTEALQILPRDADAQAGLTEAQRRLDADTANLQEFDRRLKAAGQDFTMKKYRDAYNELTEALKLVPNHPKADLYRSQVKYADSMTTGGTA